LLAPREEGPLIRRAGPRDHPWIIATAERLFADLGDYAWILGQWLPRPGVTAWLDEGDGRARGFVLLAFYQEAATPGGPRLPVADLLALGVVPEHRRAGIGAALLAHAVAAASRAAATQGIATLRLTVAADNHAAQRLYATAGFVPGGAPAGGAAPAAYSSGAPAVRLVRALSAG